MILVAYRHGFRAAELCDLRWDQIDFRGAVLHALWIRNGMPSTHPIQGDELRALRRLQRESEASPFVFVSERGSPFTTAGFARMLERTAAATGLGIKAHPHMLRDGCGYALAKQGHDTQRDSRRGNRYLRALFVQAAWVVLVKLGPKQWERYQLKSWIEAAKKRLHHNVLAIALANKLARIAWAVLRKGRVFECLNANQIASQPA
jgi:integrase